MLLRLQAGTQSIRADSRDAKVESRHRYRPHGTR